MKKILPVIIIVLLVSAGAFYAGTRYQQGKVPAGNLNAAAFSNMTQEQRQALMQQRQQDGGNGTGAVRGNRAGGGFTAGEIISKDDKSITIKLQDGGSKIVFLSETTPITKSVNGVAIDLSIGEQVTISGTANQDGSLTAQTIQIRPAQTQTPQ